MSMDSAMDSLSTTSEHSIASSTESPANIKQPHSPQDHRLQQQQQQHQQEQQQQRHLQEQQQQQRHNQEQRQQHQATSLTNHSGSHRSSPPGGNPNTNSNQTNINNNNRTPTPVSPIGRQGSSPLGSIGPHMMPMPHPLSPPQVSTPNSIAAMPRMPHLPPHGLGLLNSLQMMHHANPLELMAAAHHHVPPRSYNSPPPISTSDPTANECKLVDYRGQKVAAFIIAGDTMLCLPQAFELFLKHLVGGLHTVYTKLKRLDIVPLVCNVEQVRILRGLGAIQPGVNRCKLLSCKDFDILYRDCTTARCLSIKPPESSRPGRPPKRGPVGLSLPATTHLSHHPQLKKHRLDNGDYPYENGHLGDISRLEKSPLLANGYNPPPTHLNHMQFMQMNHHPGAAALMSPGMPPHGIPRPDGPLMKGQPGMQGMEAIARSGIWENCRAAYEDIVKHLERLREERGDDRVASMDQKPRDLSSHNGSSNGQSPVLNLSKSGMDHSSHGEQSDRSDGGQSPVPSVHDDEDNMSDENVSDVDDRDDKDEDGDLSDVERDLPPPPPTSVPSSNDSHQQAALNYSSLAATAAAVAASGVTSSGGHPGQEQNLSSTETLLRNIQSLLKVAADNARQQERQITYEKAELKMDVLREREVKDSLERQLSEEQKLRGLYQKRFKKERRVRMRLQQQIDCELKRRQQLEDALKASGGPAEALRLISENTNNDRRDRSESSDSRRPDSPYAPPGRPEAPPQPPPSEGKPWNYSGLDLMATGAFWQNYSESLAQELELERKARQQANEQDVKSPLQDRPNYYKNSVLFSSAT